MNPNKIASLLREEVEGKNVDAQKEMNLMGDESMKGEEIKTPQSQLDLPATPKDKGKLVKTYSDVDLEDDNPYADEDINTPQMEK